MLNSINSRIKELGLSELSDSQLAKKLGISVGDIRCLRRLRALSLGTLLTLCRRLEMDILIYSKSDLNLKMEAKNE